MLLGYSQPHKAYPLINDEWKFTWSQLAGQVTESSLHPSCSSWHPKTLFVSEPGVYSLVFRSHKPEAKRFTDHVVEVILPAIREKGGYISPNATASQVNSLIETLREQLSEKERTLTETKGMLEEKERILTETQGVLEEKERILNETQGVLEEKERTLTETQGMLEETQSVMVEKDRVLVETHAEKERMAVETREVLAEKNRVLEEKNRMLAEEMQQKRRLQNNIQTVRPKVAVIPDREMLRHTLSVFQYENQYKCIRTQKRNYKRALRRIPEEFQLVDRIDNVPNAVNIVNRLRELLPNARFRHNTITSDVNVVALIRQCIENEINRPITYNSSVNLTVNYGTSS